MGMKTEQRRYRRQRRQHQQRRQKGRTSWTTAACPPHPPNNPPFNSLPSNAGWHLYGVCSRSCVFLVLGSAAPPAMLRARVRERGMCQFLVIFSETWGACQSSPGGVGRKAGGGGTVARRLTCD